MAGKFNPIRFMVSSNCVNLCMKQGPKVLDIVEGVAKVACPAACIGDGVCMVACPTKAVFDEQG